MRFIGNTSKIPAKRKKRQAMFWEIIRVALTNNTLTKILLCTTNKLASLSNQNAMKVNPYLAVSYEEIKTSMLVKLDKETFKPNS